MDILRTYIAQTKNDGTTTSPITTAKDILKEFGMAVEDFPFVTLPETKELPVHDWNDEDGEEVYIPTVRRVQAYDLTVKFLYVGTDNLFRQNLDDFIKFLYGRNTDAVGSRLVIYDEHVQMGRKDITVKNVSTELFFRMDNTKDDDPVVAEFDVTFRVHNPIQEVGITRTNTGTTFTTKTGVKLPVYTTSLSW